jgi:hypothetical protein
LLEKLLLSSGRGIGHGNVTVGAPGMKLLETDPKISPVDSYPYKYTGM